MDRSEHSQRPPAPLGSIEPHAPLLSIPPEVQLLYKAMTVENLLRSVTGNYLHFNRVDSYSDFQNADENDGQQLPKDQPANAAARLQKDPDFSAADYYDQSRARTYACCFSIENSDYIWKNYANGSAKGKVSVVFEFGKLRVMLNRALNPVGAALICEGNVCRQIFSINYGLANYVERDPHQTNEQYTPLFALLGAAGTERTEPTPEGGQRLALQSVVEFVNGQMLALHQLMHESLAVAVKTHATRSGLKSVQVGWGHRITCSGIQRFRQANALVA